MREIKFRGRSIEDGKTWYTGQYYIEYSSMPHPIRTPKSLSPPSNTHWIVFPSFADWGMPREMQRVQIDHETLGQFTGLKDKNDKEIYEGDVVKACGEGGGDPIPYEVEYCGDRNYPAFDLKGFPDVDSNSMSYCLAVGSLEIIGTIYENPELLK